MIDLAGIEAGAYLRASDDKAAGSDLEEFSVSGQEDEAFDVADELHVHLPRERIYCDNDAGASKFSRKKKRDDWDKLLAAIDAGLFRLLIMWECSRGSRRHLEWAQFLDLIERKRLLVYVVSKHRLLDPTDPNDWEVLANEGVKSASEANQISMRVHRGVRRARRRGRPLGMPPFGWASVHDEKTGKMITWVPSPGDLAVVEEAFARVVQGETLISIALDYNERTDLPEGDPRWVPRTRRGKLWSGESLKATLISPTHIGKFWGKDKDGKRVLLDGEWAGAIDEDVWWSAHNILTGRPPRRSRPGGVRHLLPMIARCDECGSWLGAGTSPQGRPILVCMGINDDRSPKPRVVGPDGRPRPRSGHVAIRMSWADEYVRDEVVDRLCDPAIVVDLTAEVGEEQAKAKAEAAKIRADIAVWKELAHTRAIEAAEYVEYKTQWEPVAVRLEEESEEGLRPGATIALGLLRDAEEAGVAGDDLREALLRTWKKLSVQARRFLVQELTESVTIARGRRGCRELDPARITIV